MIDSKLDRIQQQNVVHVTLDQYLANISSEDLVVVSPASYYKLSSYCQQQLKIRCNMVFTTDIQSVGIKTFAEVYQPVNAVYAIGGGTKTFAEIYQPDNTVYAIGGGTAIDFAKYLAAQSGVRCVVIPSMLSTNAFATNKVAILEDGYKHTESSILPEEIVLDDWYLSQSPRENLYGLVDVYSIFIALADWELAERNAGATIDQDIYDRAKELLVKAVVIGNAIARQCYGTDLNRSIFDVVQEAGYITNEYGSGRPESGSEHIFAATLEAIQPIPHALAVTLGMHVMLYYYQTTQHLSSKWVKAFHCIPFSELGIIDDINARKLSWSLVQLVLKNMVPRSDKYTIVDTLNIGEPPDELRQHLKQFGIVLED